MGLFDDSSTDALSELDSLIYDPEQDVKTRQMAKQVRRMQRDVEDAGIDPGETQPRQSFFMQLLDTLDAPRQGIAGIVDTALRGDMFTGDVGLGFQRGQQENTSTSDILRRHDIIDNPVLRGVVGFAGDILTDPLNYLTLGTGAAAKQGGRVLTEAGIVARDAGIQKLAANGITDLIQQSDTLDETFRAIDRFQEAKKIYDESDSIVAGSLAADKMSKARDIISKIYNPSELPENIFEAKKLRIGINVPFLGHLQGKQDIVEEVTKDAGVVGQALRTAGKVFKPGRVSLAEIETSPQLASAIQDISSYANEALGNIGKQIVSTPVVGKPIESIAKSTKRTFQTANNLLKQVFSNKATRGPNVQDASLRFNDFKAGAQAVSQSRTFDVLGPELMADIPTQKEVILSLDALASRALTKAVEIPEGIDNITKTTLSARHADALESINRIAQSGEVLDGDILAIDRLVKSSGAEEAFNLELKTYLADPNVAPQIKDGMIRTLKGMEDLAAEEAANGLNYPKLSAYVPHRFKALSEIEQKGLSTGKTAGFAEARKYLTLSDAFKERGLVGDTELASLLQGRFERSTIAMADKRFAKRLALEEGLDEGIVTKLYKEALTNPGGEAAKVLQRYKVDLKPFDLEGLKEGSLISQKQAAAKAIAEGKGSTPLSLIDGKEETTIAKLVADTVGDFSQKTHEKLWAAGFKPLDTNIPDHMLGEIGGHIDLGDTKVFVPRTVADAYKEVRASRDILKDALGGSQFGKASLKAVDNVTSFFKKWNTVPWPAYWGQNFLGDRFNQMLQGIEAYDPGVFARTYSLLAGKSAIKNKAGQILTKETMEKIMKDHGLTHTLDDFIGTVSAFGDSDIDVFLAKKQNSILQNVKKGVPLLGNPDNRAAAWSQVSDKMTGLFDGFQRAAHFVHRFEKGDSVNDAMRSAQEAYFNYRDLTSVEQSFFRRFFMFYGYMSKATKRSMTDLVTQPGNITSQLHGVNALAEMFSDPDAAPTAEQRDFKLLQSTASGEQISRMIGTSPEGKPIIARGFGAPLNATLSQFSVQMPRNFSISELLDMVGDSAKRTIQKQFAVANPVLNSLTQVVSGKNLYFDKPLDAEFLRKLPDYTSAAEKIAGFTHSEVPIAVWDTINDAAKEYLDASPDGKGRMVINPSKMWILINLVPGLSRAISTAGNFTNEDVPIEAALMRFGLGTQIDDPDISRSFLYSLRDELSGIINNRSVKYKLEQQQE